MMNFGFSMYFESELILNMLHTIMGWIFEIILANLDGFLIVNLNQKTYNFINVKVVHDIHNQDQIGHEHLQEFLK